MSIDLVSSGVPVIESASQGVSRASMFSKVHELKSWPHLFEAVMSGAKKHELRRGDDREFRVGDILDLREFDPETGRYTGRRCRVEVTYITSTDNPCALSSEALAASHCILSISQPLG